jgi:predicted hotdog family 3-hydroxylacyl-ACP dehydratase
MNYGDIRELLPHGGDMVLLERVISADEENVCAQVTIGPDSVFFDGAGVGSWVGVEYMAQAIAVRGGYLARLRGEPVKAGFLLGARRYTAAVPSFPLGTVLHVVAHHAMQGDNGLAAFECRIDDAATGAQLAQATITVYEPDNVDEFLKRSIS